MRISIGDSFGARIQETGGSKEEWREQEVEGDVDVSAFRPPSPIFSKAALPFDLSYSMLRARFVKEDRYGLA